MPVLKLWKTFSVAQGIKLFLKLDVSATRGERPEAAPRRIERQNRRIERQNRQMVAQNRQIEHLQKKLSKAVSRLKSQTQRIGRQNRQLELQNRQMEAQNRQIEHLQKKLFEANLSEALWERGKDYATWEAGKYPEVGFWRRFLASGGLDWPEDYKQRLDPEHPLEKHVTEYLEHLKIPPGSEVCILDVGAGPLTKLGMRWEERTVSITAVDVLAKSYEHLLAEFGITPRVRTEPGEVEQLTELFPPNHFDLVHMENALDHSYDPLRGIQQMLEVVKPGHYVLLIHNVNEAENKNYNSFHQWNFCTEEGRFIIWNQRTRICVNEVLGEAAEITVDKRWGHKTLVSLKKAR